MDDQNVVAARLGLPFKCGVCRKVHEKADLSKKDVCRCFAKVWDSALGYKPAWFSPNGDEYISKPTCELRESEYFNVPKIIHSYPIENDVFMLAFPMEKTVESLRKKYRDWKDDCLKQDIRLIEEKGELNVQMSEGRLVINGILQGNTSYPLCLIMMKRPEVASALGRIRNSPILDVEWKSLKESAKLLVSHYISGKKFTMFASEGTGIANVPNGISSVRDAENFLRKLDSNKKNIATLRALFAMVDISIRHLIRTALLKSGLNEYAERIILLPPLDDSRMKDAKALLEEALRSLERAGKKAQYHSTHALKAGLSALSALEKTSKSIVEDMSDDTIQDNFSQALYWTITIENQVIIRCGLRKSATESGTQYDQSAKEDRSYLLSS